MTGLNMSYGKVNWKVIQLSNETCAEININIGRLSKNETHGVFIYFSFENYFEF